MRRCLMSVVGVALLAGLTLGADPPAPPKPPEPKAAPVVTKISGPYTHDNLSIFLLHGADTISGRKFLTLNEALEQKKIVVIETSNVNTLAVENTSDDVEVFIQTGDIVKGGRQDRLMAFDMIVPPKSGKMPIPSFCVESGRWSQRGQESAAQFGENSRQGGKDLKLAANAPSAIPAGDGQGGGISTARMVQGAQPGSQREVWNKVKEAQMKLEKSVGKPVAGKASPTSYQLTTEDKNLLEKLAKYEKELAGILKDKSDVIGIAYTINGQIEGAEVFACAELCAKQWPKMLKSCAVDALADFDAKKKFDAPKEAQVKAFLKDATGPVKEVAQDNTVQLSAARQAPLAPNPAPNSAGGQRQVLNPSAPPQQAAIADPKPAEPMKPAPVSILQSDQQKTLMVECRDKDAKGAVMHRSYMRKDEPKPPPPKQQAQPPNPHDLPRQQADPQRPNPPPNPNDQQKQQQEPPKQQERR
ncbi:MAG TPA: DUF6569 family protein [Gemmataceae bacterium]|nr:DUF6569 family protein [Gemmataceae bacterium]